MFENWSVAVTLTLILTSTPTTADDENDNQGGSPIDKKLNGLDLRLTKKVGAKWSKQY